MDWLYDIAQGSMCGLVAGGILGGLRHHAQMKNTTRIEACSVDISYLKQDVVFLDTVLDLMPYTKRNKRSAQLCNVIARNANELVQCHVLLNTPNPSNAGALRFKANRRFEGLQDASRALCTVNPNDLDIGAYVTSLQQCADNYIHNMTLN